MSQEIGKFIYDRCKYYRWNGKHAEALEMLRCYAKLNDINLTDFKYKPGDLRIFISMMEEFSIYAYYTGLESYGNIVSDKLLLSKHIGFNRYQVICNQRYYMKSLPRVGRVKIYAKADKDYVNLNASIVKTADGYILNARTVNYELTEEGGYIIKDGTPFVNTINYILFMNKEYVVEHQHKLVDKSVFQEYHSTVKGLEDVVLFHAKDKELWCTCTCRDTNPVEIPQMCLCKIDFDGDFIVTSKRPIYLIQDQRPEKNWLPFFSELSGPLLDKGPESSFKFVYSYNPFIIRSIRYDGNVIKEPGYISSEISLDEFIPDFDMSRFRGSAGPLKFDDGCLFIIHEVIFLSDTKRNYTHRFVLTTEDYHIIKLSLPYHFEESSVEFCRSMCWSHDEHQVLLTVGRKDSESWLYILHETMIKELLFDINFFKF